MSDEWSESEDPGVEPGGYPVNNLPHLLGSDPDGCVYCREALEAVEDW